MASDPVFQARLGQRPQDTAVPSCFPNDIVQKTYTPTAPSSADQGTQVSGPFWGHVTLGEQDRGQDLLGSQSLGKLLTS